MIVLHNITVVCLRLLTVGASVLFVLFNFLCALINVSQGSVGMHLRSGGILEIISLQNFTAEFVDERILKSVHIWRTYQHVSFFD